MRLRSLWRFGLALVVCHAPLWGQVVRYEVSVPAPATHLFHVAAQFPAVGRETLFVSLPAWSPGYYSIQNYARYVRHFAAADAAGRPLFWDRADKDTWRIVAGKTAVVTVEFDYLADTVDLAIARLGADFGQFLGTNLFLYEEGQLDRPSEVRIRVPDGWRVTTALSGGSGGVYRAANYHELTDAMTFVGSFALDSVQVDGHWIRVALSPAEDYRPAVARHLREAIARLATVQNRLMGGPPYETYTIFFSVIHEPVQFGGGLEHAASQYDIMPAMAFADDAGTLGDFIVPLISHEFFHLWNVKRIRPVEMWPYDYHAEQYTPLLWWSEGVTDYYADIANLRSGLWDEGQFLANVAQNMDQVEAAPEPWSEEDGSVATWIDEVFVNSSQLYYPKGSLTGLVLDAAIRDATDNRHSLDDVMRALFTRYYGESKGFGTADLLALLTEFGMPDVDQFYQRHVNGREPLPYERVLAKAGIAVTRETTTTPFLGVQMSGRPDVVAGVVAGGAAETAGVQPGDTLRRIGEIAVGEGDWGQAFRERYRGHAGEPLAIVVRRAGSDRTLQTVVRERTITTWHVAKAAHPDARASAIWQGMAGRPSGN